MILSTMSFRRIGCISLGVLLVTTLGCETAALEHERQINPSVVVITLEEKFGPLQRPVVEFDHDKHTKALEKEGCKACHLSDARGKQLSKFGRTEDAKNLDAQKDLYHDRCMSCHKERTQAGKDSGPVVCGECHKIQLQPVSLRDEMGFDYSLHYRHVVAAEEKCEKCHHVYNEKLKKLEYKKGESEDACSDCHGEKDDGRNLSLKNASHRECVNCHLERSQSKQKTGPTRCIGCHDADVVEGYDKLPAEKIGRLKRKQPDRTWITSPDAKSKAVAFNHETHEPEAKFCTTCHHKTPGPCKECHTLTGKEDGSFVTTAKAYHLASSERSCVGCHNKETDRRDCSGCHDMPLEVQSTQACVTCHNGPLDVEKTAVALDGSVSDQTEGERVATSKRADVHTTLLESLLNKEPELVPLPAPSDDEFPETIIIKTLANKYESSKMPHQKIVARLDKIVRGSKLAQRFHRRTETLCAGCHHHSPLGVRPGPCTACHSNKADPIRDKPSLKAAYHRQCMGCHQKMKIEKALECTECHKETAKGESK